jgi:CubicO group peptidase (beta-lactamase class C family)
VPAPALQGTLSPDERQSIDQIARDTLSRTGVPSASLAVVKDGKIAYLQAYGDARLAPRVPARPAMRYSIGSISKQFAAVAILMLQEEGKLSLDDKVGKFFPALTKADEVTIRQLLSHTSGYQDYWPQDYVPPLMLQPTTAAQIMDRWARKPLDFAPGAKWQYSNTNYVIAGAIAEKASGVPLFQFLQERIFGPLGMTSVVNIDQEKLADSDPAGYFRYALGPLRNAPKEGKGWIFAAGELAMTAEDLAKWDLSIAQRRLMKSASYREFEAEVLLSDGLGTGYGLGLDVRSDGGHRVLEHSGEVSGFTADNMVFPDDDAGVAVLTNQDAARAAAEIAHKIAPLLLAVEDPASAQEVDRARGILIGLQAGNLDRSLFTENANSYFSQQAIADFARSLAPYGSPVELTETMHELRGGMELRVYRAKFSKKELRVWTYKMPDGKLEQFMVAE